ncbi:hypothetical protein KVH22_25360 [Streptomyces olivaceus]|uniref:hypothetical protein n=1 Tax=Streptomyces olivaceus TaxID=47716 RepID=UPI001CCD052C|nr:hypothetical protein [Streptomyces olivaceus]MBZ6258847.1 hypothetical protein [Streptomyces olivaceus]
MSADQAQPTEPGETTAAAAEPSGMSDRTARLVLLAVVALAMWGIVAVLPETAYVIVGIIATLGWQRARRWLRRRRGDEGQDDTADGEKRPETVAETLHRLAAPHVFLADFATARGQSKDTARAVLEALGIRVRRAVRNGNSTGVGVHKDDIPPLPRPLPTPPVDGVDQGQPTNQHGVRIERTETGGYRIFDLADTHRHHQVDGH